MQDGSNDGRHGRRNARSWGPARRATRLYGESPTGLVLIIQQKKLLYNPLKGQGSDFFPPSLPQNWECCGKIKGQFFWVWRSPLEHNITHACTHVRTRSWQLGLLFEPKTSFLLMSYWLFSRPVSSWLSRCRPATPTWWSSSGGRCRAGAGPFHLRRAATHHSNIPQHQDSRGSNWKILSACKVLSYCLYFGMLFPIKIISV